MTAILRRECLDVRGIRERLGKGWDAKDYGDDSVLLEYADRRIIVSYDPDSEPGVEWVHASISYRDQWRMPSYSDLKQMAAAVWPGGYCYQAFVPPAAHINIRTNVLHLWGHRDGSIALPNFGREGTI